MGRTGNDKKGSQAKAKGKAPAEYGVPDVYREMLADAVSSSPTQRSEDGRAVKRRRVGGRIVTQANGDTTYYQSDKSSKRPNDSDLDELLEDVQPAQQQIVQSDSEDSADSDMNWEEVDMGEQIDRQGTPEPGEAKSGDLNLVLHDEDNEHRSSGREKAKRKPITAEEKMLRLEIHKMHLCSLLAHVYLRNHWCNDERIHSALRKLLTSKITSYLNPDETKSQFQRSRSFMDGLEQASDAFRNHFKITARGMGRSRWADSSETLALLQPPDDIDLPIQLSDFRDAARKLRGSRDVGTQVFCALLRSARTEARLVCSLHPLPFQPAQKIELSQIKQNALKLRTQVREKIPGQDSENDTGTDGSLLGRSVTPEPASSSIPVRSKVRKPIRESKYPMYWVEAFNEALQKWVPVDPLVTKSIAKPSKFEPPACELENYMSYVVAFEDDGSARDVTRRYAKAYNAKTRRDRVEVTTGGERWWRRVMRMYKRRHALDRDQVEDAELASKEAAEPMPRNVQDFKDHPYYALERHLKRQEVIHPKREVGKVGAGRAGNTTFVEPIYRRRDVYMVRSADKWYRMGREIKPCEQPLKRVPARRTRGRSLEPEDLDPTNEDHAGTALYAAHQTTLYCAPPVVNGRIPKNVYGNLDLYVLSMVPPGGAHIPHPETSRAARILGIDYADAVTGFSFRGRHGTAVIKGAVVASEYREAVEAVIQAFEDERTQAEEQRRSLEALRMWKRLLAGLRIRQRIKGYKIEGEPDAAMQEVMEKVDDDEDEDEGGGFLPDLDREEYVQPTGGRSQAQNLPDAVEDEHGGFLTKDMESEPERQPTADATEWRPTDRFIDSFDDDDGGGFLINDGDADAEDALRDAKDNDHELATESRDSSSRERIVQKAALQGEATLNLPQDELEEARLLQQLYEAEDTTVSNAPDNKPATRPDQQSTSPPRSGPITEEPVKSESSDSEMGSLLSHDPDDEDADPEWIT